MPKRPLRPYDPRPENSPFPAYARRFATMDPAVYHRESEMGPAEWTVTGYLTKPSGQRVYAAEGRGPTPFRALQNAVQNELRRQVRLAASTYEEADRILDLQHERARRRSLARHSR